jgi:hypothetical protein
VLLHGFSLTAINLVSILVGLVIWYLMVRPGAQVVTQGVIALAITVAVYPGWNYLLLGVRGGRFHLRVPKEALWTFFAALIWLPILLVPLHFLRRGYLTAFSNIWMTWLLQVPANALALLAALFCPKCRKGVCKI